MQAYPRCLHGPFQVGKINCIKNKREEKNVREEKDKSQTLGGGKDKRNTQDSMLISSPIKNQ